MAKTFNFGKDTITVSGGKGTNIAFGMTAEYAYKRYLEKKQQIYALEYECELLIDKYHSEMKNAEMPSQFREDVMDDMFGKDKKHQKFARGFFLERGFSEEFLKQHKVEFIRRWKYGYGHPTSFGVVLGIGDYEYTIEIPLPQNIIRKEDKERLMGEVKFRVDRIHKSKTKEFVREMESVQMPTYDWKECFEAIEAVVEGKEGVAV